jgi:ATP-dependent Clp protease protease subunit
MLEKMNIVLGGKKQLNDNFFLLFSEIDLEISQQVVEWILGHNFSENPPEILTLVINSPGGSLSAAWAIIDAIRGSHIPVRMIGLGEIASAGLLIFISGNKGMRFLTDNTSIMSHQYFWGTIGKHHELIAVQTEYSNVQKRLIEHYKKTTGLDEHDINKYLMPPHDVYLTSKEALKLGICDHIKTLK